MSTRIVTAAGQRVQRHLGPVCSPEVAAIGKPPALCRGSFGWLLPSGAAPCPEAPGLVPGIVRLVATLASSASRRYPSRNPSFSATTRCPMQVSEYQREELHFAYAYHVYLHWRTHRRKPFADLATLDCATLDTWVQPLGLHLLECDSQPIETRALVSLRPDEPVSACASKLKGQVSKWLRQQLRLQTPATLLARGYFACTAGVTTTGKVEAYLETQGEHHGYSQRVLPPVFVQTFQPDREPQPWLQADHACTHLQFHLVLATLGRRGVFASAEGRAVTERWLALQREHRFALREVSFVPDHVHVAFWLHPAASPARLVVTLMNEAQRLLAADFSEELIRAGVPRLWQPSAYLDSYGELATPQVQQYIRRWQVQE
jgi:REP element-mobilizing transposase RayT